MDCDQSEIKLSLTDKIVISPQKSNRTLQVISSKCDKQIPPLIPSAFLPRPISLRHCFLKQPLEFLETGKNSAELATTVRSVFFSWPKDRNIPVPLCKMYVGRRTKLTSFLRHGQLITIIITGYLEHIWQRRGKVRENFGLPCVLNPITVNRSKETFLSRRKGNL